MFISKDVYYGIRGLIYISKKRVPVPIKEISEKEEIPSFFLEKIFQKLKEGGLVDSRKGSGGGYFLTLDTRKITLRKIFLALKKNDLFPPCSKTCLKEKGCQLKTPWQDFYLKLNFLLDQTTLDSFLK